MAARLGVTEQHLEAALDPDNPAYDKRLARLDAPTRRYLSRLSNQRPWRKVAERYRIESQSEVKGLKAIGARLNVGRTQLKALRDPKNPAFDALVARVIKRRNGRYFADPGILTVIAFARMTAKSKRYSENVGKRCDRNLQS